MARASGHGHSEGVVTADGYFPRDTVGYRGHSHAAEVSACLGRRHDAKRVKEGPEQASVFPFLFHLTAFFTAIVKVIVLCFSLKIKNKSLKFTP